MNDDTVTIERLCGTCFFFTPMPLPPAANNETPGNADIPKGFCIYNPPTVFLVQQQHPISHQMMPGTTALNPTVNTDRPACHGWCPSGVDPFWDPEP